MSYSCHSHCQSPQSKGINGYELASDSEVTMQSHLITVGLDAISYWMIDFAIRNQLMPIA